MSPKPAGNSILGPNNPLPSAPRPNTPPPPYTSSVHDDDTTDNHEMLPITSAHFSSLSVRPTEVLLAFPRTFEPDLEHGNLDPTPSVASRLNASTLPPAAALTYPPTAAAASQRLHWAHTPSVPTADDVVQTTPSRHGGTSAEVKGWKVCCWCVFVLTVVAAVVVAVWGLVRYWWGMRR
ncbi:uncharacterized protein EKO05_0005737 [Ascochyta rabiei]|uniref:Uncharacterized protein n=1 Tax=Didymella rabiei TaxID=5454 RepID=A0A163LX29_DIDRA|nr:uncharacterized protein EKO05_0005737 [Ascochyta rabiei]KZM28201.1 hypothetical protein ST47_g647 [Ascochyta rabiei]UPX15283.1 hypothetical protein EKO05_0005737 [Ascochyta rabiei]